MHTQQPMVQQCHPNCLMNLRFQFPTGPLPDYNAQLHHDPTKQVEAAQTEAQAKVRVIAA